MPLSKDLDPINPMPGLITIVEMKFLPSVEDSVKSVDDHKMIITMEPVIYTSWEDPRWIVTSPSDTFLPDSMLEKMWYPKIITERIPKRINPYPDPGYIRKCSFEERSCIGTPLVL